MLSLITSENDIKTDGPWAAHVNVSLSVLRDCCKRLDVGVESARNFCRGVRAILRSGDDWTPETLLDIDDVRTLRKFEQRLGIHREPNTRGRDVRTPTMAEFFEGQTWLPHDNPVVLRLEKLLMEKWTIGSQGSIV
jgi:hypothetical protein